MVLFCSCIVVVIEVCVCTEYMYLSCTCMCSEYPLCVYVYMLPRECVTVFTCKNILSFALCHFFASEQFSYCVLHVLVFVATD